MEQDLHKRAKLRCLHLLERRDYTEKQLRDKLRASSAGYTEEMIEGALEYVKGYRYVDDARYAAQYVECMKDKKSRRQIEQELYQRGVDRQKIAEALEAAEEVPEEKLIRKWLEKRHFNAETADLQELRRTYAFLARKGFSSESIKSAMQSLDR